MTIRQTYYNPNRKLRTIRKTQAEKSLIDFDIGKYLERQNISLEFGCYHKFSQNSGCTKDLQFK